MELDRVLVMPGDEVRCPQGSMPGFGTYENSEGKIVANQIGYPAIYNKLVCVNPVRGRYIGETSNVIIGRIAQVANKRWKVDVGSPQEAVLHLSAIDLPTGEHRIRSEEDQLHMREYFNYNDLLSVTTN
jgi:exosome complex component RRP4